MKKTFTLIKDGFKNIVKGLGTSKDPREDTHFVRGVDITLESASALYVYNWVAAKIVDIPIDDATSKWRKLIIPDTEEKKEVEDVYKKLDIKGKINTAMKWARIYGGAVILIILEGQDPEEELDLENIPPGSLSNLIVLDRYNIYPEIVDRDILSPNFGKPEYYRVVRGSGQKIHHSRVIRFDGIMTTLREAERKNFWGSSIFQKCWDPIKDQGVVSQSIANLIYESNVDVYRIHGLNEAVSMGKDDYVINRLKIAHEMKSIINGIALDKEDEYDKKTNVFTTLPDIDDRFMQKVTGSANIPITRFLGVSPSGLNATGDSDERIYLGFVSNIQENDIRPQLDILDIIVMSSEFPGKEVFEYKFVPLQQLTESEQAEVDNKNATTDQIYWNMDVLEVSDVQARLVENNTYPTIDSARVEETKAEEDLLELEEENEEEIDENSKPTDGSEGVGKGVSETDE